MREDLCPDCHSGDTSVEKIPFGKIIEYYIICNKCPYNGFEQASVNLYNKANNYYFKDCDN